MAMIIEHIDKISRDKQRDVIYIVFFENLRFDYDYKNCKTRQAFMKWMDDNQITYEKCAPIARETGWEAYRGQNYTLIYLWIKIFQNFFCLTNILKMKMVV